MNVSDEDILSDTDFLSNSDNDLADDINTTDCETDVECGKDTNYDAWLENDTSSGKEDYLETLDGLSDSEISSIGETSSKSIIDAPHRCPINGAWFQSSIDEASHQTTLPQNCCEEETWECCKCTVLNIPDFVYCIACSTKKK
uniref:RanBP2-type domain-containing protein n=1 Tax=Rhabditophanes sp. KR3021 TaxID=114890 RepID=A0AC35TKF5_9BILA